MKKMFTLVTILLVLASLLLGCGTSQPKPQAKSTEITISAAASLKHALTEIATNYKQQKPEVKLTFNYGGSGTLQQQIQQGAPVDLFISAGKTQMDTLASKNLLLKGSRVDLLSNSLVLIAGKDNNSITSLRDLATAQVNKIGIGTPETVPAGKYAQEALISAKLWDTLQPRLVLATDVTQVLNYVETGAVDAGLVYSSDAKVSSKIKVVAEIPTNTYKSIVYPAAVINGSEDQAAAQDFLQYLQSANAQQVFVKYGFKTLSK